MTLKIGIAKSRCTITNLCCSTFLAGSDVTSSSADSHTGSEDACDCEEIVPMRGTSPVDFHLMPQVEDIAINFFFEHYAKQRASPVVDALRGLYYTSRIKSEPAVDNAISAIALASFSRFPDMTRCHADASRHYEKALRLVGKALSDPVQSKNDETLLCVILMGMYEVRNKCFNPRKPVWG